MKGMEDLLKLRGKNFIGFPLDWDTEYFGVPSARVNLKGIATEKDQTKILAFCRKYEFVTIYNAGNIKENNNWIGRRTNAFLSDVNIQFVKANIGESLSLDKDPEIYNSYPRNEKIIKIAESAYRYSRFYNDPYLPKSKAAKIYLHWTECAFNHKEKYFVIEKKCEEIAGYILFSVNEAEHTLVIELIAVDEKFRGERVGRSLISAIELFCNENGYKSIRVGTQADNISAIQFYFSCGFKYVSCNSVYHLWSDSNYINLL